MKDRLHIHACMLGGISILTDHLLGESIMLEWAALPFSLGLLFIIIAVRQKKISS